MKKYRRQGDLRKTVLVYTAFVGPAHVTDSVEARHRIIGDRRVTLWSESVAHLAEAAGPWVSGHIMAVVQTLSARSYIARAPVWRLC